MDERHPKQCCRCGAVKPLNHFYRAASATDGRQAACKDCHRESARSYRDRMKAANDARPFDPTARKRCPSCGEERAATAFHRNRTSKDGLHWVCKACNQGGPYSPEQEQRRRFRRYAITPEEVQALLIVQQRACAICVRPFVATEYHVDHCHDSGEVRGLLCSVCNSGLGLLGDDASRLRAGIRYLDEPPIRMVRPP
jgi:hypothetical protein